MQLKFWKNYQMAYDCQLSMRLSRSGNFIKDCNGGRRLRQHLRRADTSDITEFSFKLIARNVPKKSHRKITFECKKIFGRKTSWKCTTSSQTAPSSTVDPWPDGNK
jgi:hypothetical protein